MKRIAGLREAGYEIEVHPLLGTKLVAAPDRLIADDLFPAAEAARIGRRILVFEQTASTNDLAAKLGREGEPEGLVVFAESQTSGRGRLGRRWESECGQGLYFSLLLRPNFERQYWMNLTTWAAVAVAEGIEQAVSCEAKIKWPNDIYIEGKKAVGILSELHTDKESNAFAIVGIGVNVNQQEFPESLASKAISLQQIAKTKVNRREVALRILEALERSYSLVGGFFNQIVAEADRRSYLKGRRIRLEAGTSTIEGIAGDLDCSGALQICQSSGEMITVSSGEVTVAGIAIQ